MVLSLGCPGWDDRYDLLSVFKAYETSSAPGTLQGP